MNISTFSAPSALYPLQCLWRWFTTTAAHGKPMSSNINNDSGKYPVSSVTSSARCHMLERHSSTGASAHRPLRIIRILEASQAPTQAGRMVISGRMADVCAELDRLAAREATLH